jgi:cephalosporin hydroxylase
MTEWTKQWLSMIGWIRAMIDARSPVATVRHAVGLERQRSVTLMEWVNYNQHHVIPSRCHWRGVRTLKNPLDCWVYQEILAEVQPDVIVEIGTKNGGSTLMLADFCTLLGHGEVIGIDIDHSHYDPAARHPLIHLITGDSNDPAVVEQVAERCQGRSVLVIHDGLHRREEVLRDLHAYGRLVTPGSYLIVEDTTDDLRGFVRTYPATGFLRFADYAAASTGGALEAVRQFIAETPEFHIDREREKYILTTNVMGYLRRTR